MPITQTRMLNLVEETWRFISEYEGLIKRIENVIASAGISDGEIRTCIRAELDMSRELRPVYAILEQEAYNRNHKRNDKLRVRAERKRREAGVPQRDSAQYAMNALRGARDSRDAEYDKWMGGAPIQQGERNAQSDVIEKAIENAERGAISAEELDVFDAIDEATSGEEKENASPDDM